MAARSSRSVIRRWVSYPMNSVRKSAAAGAFCMRVSGVSPNRSNPFSFLLEVDMPMPIAQAMLQELEQEAPATQRVLERVPDAHLDWRPHPKSFSLGQLAMHVAQIPGGVATLAMQSPATPPEFVQEPARRSA